MDLSSISPAAVVADQMATTQTDFAVKMMRKVLDMEAAQGAQLAQMVAQQSGVGRGVDTYA